MKEEIMSITNSENGEVTMFLKGSGGPIITGKNMFEAKEKFNEALKLFNAVKILLKLTK